jgi:prepilin-type processing-associated H-X9-DG protein
MSPKSHRLARQRGLTLSELVVMAAIIAALAGILAPVFRPANPRSDAQRCLSNLHRIGGAMCMYADDNGGRLMWNPYYATDYANPTRDMQSNFMVGLAPYVRPETWVCPTAPLTPSVSFIPGREYWMHPDFPIDVNVYKHVSYGFNEVVFGSVGPYSGSRDRPVALHAIANPAHLALVGDADLMYASYRIRVVNGAFVADDNGLKPGELYWVWSDPKSATWFYGRIRHNGGMNFTYADGHAAFCRPVKLNPGGPQGYQYGYYPGANVY